MKPIVLGALTLLLASGCVTDPRRAPASAATPTQPAAETADIEAADSPALRAALDRGVAVQSGLDPLRLFVSCRLETTMRYLEVFGNGVAILDRGRQLSLDPGEVRSLLAALKDADFPSFAPLYGGQQEAEDEAGPKRQTENQGKLLLCGIDLRLDGARKRSTQLARGEQFPPFLPLAARLFAIVEPASARAVTAVDLGDGLDKIARGELAPETLGASLQYRGGPEGDRDLGPGFVLILRGPRLTTRAWDPEGGYGQALGVELAPAEVEELAARLAALDPEGMPGNLWAPGYVDLSLTLLGHRAAVNARPFRGLEPDTHGELQRDFEAAVEILRQLHAGAMETGLPVEDESWLTLDAPPREP